MGHFFDWKNKLSLWYIFIKLWWALTFADPKNDPIRDPKSVKWCEPQVLRSIALITGKVLTNFLPIATPNSILLQHCTVFQSYKTNAAIIKDRLCVVRLLGSEIGFFLQLLSKWIVANIKNVIPSCLLHHRLLPEFRLLMRLIQGRNKVPSFISKFVISYYPWCHLKVKMLLSSR